MVPGARCSANTIFQFSYHIDEIAVVIEIDELLTRAVRLPPREVRELVVAIKVNFKGLAPGLMALGRNQGRQPTKAANDLIRDRVGLDASRPPDHARHTERTFPVGVLFAAERRRAGVWPGVLMRAVVGGVEHDRVIGDGKLVQCLKDCNFRRCSSRNSYMVVQRD